MLMVHNEMLATNCHNAACIVWIRMVSQDLESAVPRLSQEDLVSRDLTTVMDHRTALIVSAYVTSERHILSFCA